MEMMNRAIEDAADFVGFMQKLQQVRERAREEVQQLHERDSTPHDQGAFDSDRQPGENREMHRARLKAERRAAPLKVPR